MKGKQTKMNETNIGKWIISFITPQGQVDDLEVSAKNENDAEAQLLSFLDENDGYEWNGVSPK